MTVSYSQIKTLFCQIVDAVSQIQVWFDIRVLRDEFQYRCNVLLSHVLRGIKDSPPYLYDGRLLTLEETVEFFNLVLQTNFNQEQKTDLVAFLRTL